MVDCMLSYADGRCKKLGLEETELRLGIGLPGGAGDQKSNANYGKRAFAETVDLKLNLSTKEMGNSDQNDSENKNLNKEKNIMPCSTDSVKPPAKWWGGPPVRSFRKNVMAVQKKSESEEAEKGSGGVTAAAFVKVSMDGAPYLRKVDLKMYKTYQRAV
ncbi:auxin-induced protein aux28 [Phtheirospermum japonicum]|uniref:Auxin-responsive protein n=1 Tax=Phtheirospermum japonicum TaxID=374723 RepID=A0A830CQ86_9LAMI|nr:auxin-induced protein aux28 [Phtheirospermum japonicum]